LLEQKTSLKPTEIMSDTAGASDMVFGLFWLLGYQFSPQLADAGEARFWRIDPGADYGRSMRSPAIVFGQYASRSIGMICFGLPAH